MAETNAYRSYLRLNEMTEIDDLDDLEPEEIEELYYEGYLDDEETEEELVE